MWKIFKANSIDLPVFVNLKAPLLCSLLAWLLAMAAIGTITGFIFFSLYLVYFALCGVSLLYIVSQGITRLNVTYVCMFIFFGVSALLAKEDFFNPMRRYGLFLFISLLCSPCVVSPLAVTFRSLLFRNMLILSSILALGSFFCYFIGINYMPLHLGRTDLVGNVTHTGMFGGLFVQSMVLGPMSALAALIFFNSYQNESKKIYMVLFLLAAATTLLSASRGAVLSLAVPVVYSLLFIRGGIERSKSKMIWLLIVALVVSIPVMDRLSSGLLAKQASNIEEGGTMSSREGLWNARLDEFQQSTVCGIGFCSIDRKYLPEHSIIIEPGSSHLAVLSMTGILGMIPYILVLLMSYRSVQGKNDAVAKFRLCAFLAIITHGFIEGYALSAGSVLFLYYWLIIGQCVDYKEVFVLHLVQRSSN